jgi:hypothetical protein
MWGKKLTFSAIFRTSEVWGNSYYLLKPSRRSHWSQTTLTTVALFENMEGSFPRNMQPHISLGAVRVWEGPNCCAVLCCAVHSVPIGQEAGGGLNVAASKMVLPLSRIEPPVVQAMASHYMDWAVPVYSHFFFRMIHVKLNRIQRRESDVVGKSALHRLFVRLRVSALATRKLFWSLFVGKVSWNVWHG